MTAMLVTILASSWGLTSRAVWKGFHEGPKPYWWGKCLNELRPHYEVIGRALWRDMVTLDVVNLHIFNVSQRRLRSAVRFPFWYSRNDVDVDTNETAEVRGTS